MRLASRLLLVAVTALSARCGGDGMPEGDASAIHLDAGTLVVDAVIDRSHFRGSMARAMKMDGYHLLVWEGGGAAQYSLFATPADDIQLHEALSRLTGGPGPGLPFESWTERMNAESGAPDLNASGTPLDIRVTWEGADRPLAVSEFLGDPTGRGFDFVFTGNRDNAPIWKSGCGICLVSCPGGKVGNAAYTVRDYVNGSAAFNVLADVLPPDGTPVQLLITLK